MAALKITTDRQVAGLRPGERPYEATIANVRGLSVRVFPTGTRSFEFRYVALNGVRRRLPLGVYPGLSLADAREKAQALRVAVVEGVDPVADRAAARVAARTGDTLTELADSYFSAARKGLHGGKGRPKRESTLSVETTRFRLHIEPRLGRRRFKEIARVDIRGFMRELATSGGLAADTVASVGTTLSAILAFAVHEERLEANPAQGLTRPLALRSRERMFADDALAALWRFLGAVSPVASEQAPASASQTLKPRPSAVLARVEPVTALALKFAMLTLARRADVSTASWSEIDLVAKTWTIPASRFKSGRAHVVPLSEAARCVLADAARLPNATEQHDSYIFPSPLGWDVLSEGGQFRSITPHALTRALARVLADLGLPHGSPHDFRRAGATALTGEALGFRRFVVGKVLGHAVNDGAAVTGIYDRNDYLAEKRAALEAWASHLMRLAGGESSSSNVITLRASNG